MGSLCMSYSILAIYIMKRVEILGTPLYDVNTSNYTGWLYGTLYVCMVYVMLYEIVCEREICVHPPRWIIEAKQRKRHLNCFCCFVSDVSRKCCVNLETLCQYNILRISWNNLCLKMHTMLSQKLNFTPTNKNYTNILSYSLFHLSHLIEWTSLSLMSLNWYRNSWN